MTADNDTAIDPAIAARMTTPTDHRLGSDDGLHVVFTWQTDRYAHTIYAAGGRQLIGYEGSAQDDWPASAALSQLSTEIIDGRPTILGVGCSGTTHFSVSVQLSDTGGGQPFIQFDWAARLSKPLSAIDIAETPSDQAEPPLAWLGSTYRLPADYPSDWCIETRGATLLKRAGGESPNRLILQPTRMDQVRTVEWSYRIQAS